MLVPLRLIQLTHGPAGHATAGEGLQTIAGDDAIPDRRKNEGQGVVHLHPSLQVLMARGQLKQGVVSVLGPRPLVDDVSKDHGGLLPSLQLHQAHRSIVPAHARPSALGKSLQDQGVLCLSRFIITVAKRLGGRAKELLRIHHLDAMALTLRGGLEHHLLHLDVLGGRASREAPCQKHEASYPGVSRHTDLCLYIRHGPVSPPFSPSRQPNQA